MISAHLPTILADLERKDAPDVEEVLHHEEHHWSDYTTSHVLLPSWHTLPSLLYYPPHHHKEQRRYALVLTYFLRLANRRVPLSLTSGWQV